MKIVYAMIIACLTASCSAASVSSYMRILEQHNQKALRCCKQTSCKHVRKY